jgi:predicted MFS family arabinose efflux permease
MSSTPEDLASVAPENLAPSLTRWTTASLVIVRLSGIYSKLVMPFILTAMISSFGLSEAAAGRLVSVQLAGTILASALVTSVLRPGHSVRWILALGIGAVAVANVGCALFHMPSAAIVARAFVGLGEGTIMAGSYAVVCGLVNPVGVFSAMGTASLVAAFVSLLAAPMAVSRAGPHGLFWLLALLPLLALPFMRWIPPVGKPATVAESSMLGTLLRGAPILLAILVANAGANGGMWVYAERIGASQGLTPQQMGFWLAASQIGALPGPMLAARAIRWLGMRPCIILGSLGTAAAPIFFFFGDHAWTYGFGLFLLAFFFMFMTVCFGGRMAELDPGGRTAALSIGATTAGIGLGPLVVGAIVVPGQGYAVLGFACILSFVLTGLFGATQGIPSRPSVATHEQLSR